MQVAGRAPFSVTLGAHVNAGVSPYTFDWDLNGDGKTDSRLQNPAPYVLTDAGVFTATVSVHDAEGRIAAASRRLVVIKPPAQPDVKYGVTAHLERRRAGFYPTLQEVEQAAALMERAGIQAVRIDFNWDMLNPQPDKWNFDDYDGMVRIVRAHHLAILAIVDYSSWWASSAQASNDWRVRLYSEPLNNYDFARYTYDLVSHYRGDIHMWEIWNEPNSVGFWQPKPDAARYAEVLQESYLAAKYADPNAFVLFGGLSGNGVEGDTNAGLQANFISDAYAAGAKGYFDAMAIHPYILPNSGAPALRAKIADARAVMDKNGDTETPLWLTEIGVPSDTPWWSTAPIQSEADVAAWLEQVYTKLWDQTPTIFWYDFQDEGIGDSFETRFGLVHSDFSIKPAYDRLRGLINNE